MEMINLNGVDYVKVEHFEEVVKERDELKEKISSIRELLGVASQPRRVGEGYKDTDLYVIAESYQKLYDIRFMNDSGEFFTKSNHQMAFDIKDIFTIKKECTTHMTIKEAREFRKKLNLTEYNFGRLMYNYKKGVFDKFMDEWNAKTQPKVVHKVVAPIENNPKKRKESGIYG